MIKKLDHLVITTSNISAITSFYEKLGFTAKNTGGRYELHAGDFKINVHILGNELLPHAEHVQVGSADLCFEITEGIEYYKERLEKQDVVIELGIVERTGVNGRMSSIYLRDPDGNLLEFSSYH